MDFIEINWKTVLLGEEQWEFLLETTIRSCIMFLIILFSLRLMGKRGIKQLSVFELGVIIALGSAAGDPMFYKDVGILAGLMVFIIVFSLYKLVTFLINRSERFEKFVEGEPTYMVKNGRLLFDNFMNEPIAREELFMQFRLNHVSHLGQIENAVLETNGELSLLFYPDERVRPGLPIWPHHCEHPLTTIKEEGCYSCTNCGNTKELPAGGAHTCECCNKTEWIAAIDAKRIS